METGAGESRRPKHRVPDRSPGTRGGLVGLRLRRGLYKFGRPTNNFFASRPTPRPPQPPVVWTVSFTQAAGPRNPTYAYRGPGYYGYGARAGARASTGLPVSRLRAAKDSGMAAKRARNAGRGNEKGRECTSMVQVRVGCSVRRGTSHKHTGGSRISEFSVSSSPHGTRLMESANPRCASRARVIGHRER